MYPNPFLKTCRELASAPRLATEKETLMYIRPLELYIHICTHIDAPIAMQIVKIQCRHDN